MPPLVLLALFRRSQGAKIKPKKAHVQQALNTVEQVFDELKHAEKFEVLRAISSVRSAEPTPLERLLKPSKAGHEKRKPKGFGK